MSSMDQIGAAEPSGTKRSKPARFGRISTAMVTPFDEEGRLDLDGAIRLARFLVEQGNDSLVLAGSTGEGSMLSDTEKVDLWKAVAEAVTCPVIANAGTNDTTHSIELVKKAEQVGVEGILAVTPYYVRPSQAGIEAHFKRIAEATNLPVVVYDIPVRTGRKVSSSTLLNLAYSVPNIVGVKDAAGDVAASARLLAEAPPDFELYSGDDSLTLPLLSVGGVGVIGVATHWATPVFAQMIEAYFTGRVDEAVAFNRLLLESYAFETSEETPNPLPAKAAMRALGLPAGQCRLPLGDAPDDLEERAKAVMAGLGIAATGKVQEVHG
ncbi:MAG: 4-hydroxy-tetrahydrodipicolinate synthase [Actinobacteria bacterium]|nr:4-hydroxy-tetrahydrodipicolinate synthase [Actinomycetota bacterium]MCL6095246.1 4-hydroxy-tetrahydrodipicolinate synthase [Actinomycetota bacterium]